MRSVTVTGSGLIVLLVVVAVLLPGAGVLLWPRVRGGRVLAGVQRAGILVTCQIAGLLVLAALVNDYGVFYTTWSQVRTAAAQALGLNADPARPTMQEVSDRTHSSSTRQAPTSYDPASAGSVTLLSPGPTDTAKWMQQGRVESVTITGAISGLHEQAFVYLPPQYFQPKYAQTKFPAIEVMTGYPGNDVSLVTRLHYPDVTRSLIAKGQAKPVVLVMLRPAVTFPRDAECTDIAGGSQVLTYLAADVPAQIAHAYRVQPTRWGAIGDSTGGYCSAKVAMTHPLQFSAAVSLSGYFFATSDNTTGDLWGGSAAVRNTNDLFWRIKHMPPPPVSLLIATAKTEKGDDGYKQNTSFARLVHAPMRATMLVESTGGHNFNTWNREIPTGLRWLSTRIGSGS